MYSEDWKGKRLTNHSNPCECSHEGLTQGHDNYAEGTTLTHAS